MSRLIDADALKAAFTDLRFNADGTLAHWGDRPDWCLQGREVDKLIHDAPTIDAVPVVRCSECKYGTVSTTTPMAICNHPNGLVAPRWGSWCSYGKRKEDDHE